jgi:formylglycine-generating enzyme required for sulfatase activity
VARVSDSTHSWLGGDSAAAAPKRLGPYALERELARGGMGSVHLARHVELGRQVALKLLLSDATADDAVRFEREARVLAQLRHPNVVTLHESGVDAGRRWLALELVAGGSLQGRLDRSGPLDPRAAVELLIPVARAIAAAHAAGVLHRDLKPANILLDEAGRPKVTDFGIARRLDAQTRQLTRTNAAIGTPSFAPPEQFGGEQVDARADVYGLGATLYALVAGRPPFEGSYLDVVRRVTMVEPRPPSTHQAAVPRDLDLVVLRCLEKAPADRYSSPDALAHELERWLAGEPLEVQPPSLLKRLRRWRRRRPLLALALPAALLLAVAAGLAVALRAPPPPPPPVVPTTVEWLAPADSALVTASAVELAVAVRGPAAWAEVSVDGAEAAPPRRLRGAGDFTVSARLRPGDNDVSLRWTASTGEAGVVGPRRLRSAAVHDWFERLPASARPPLPLPAGLVTTDAAGLYRCVKDGSTLVWVPPGTFDMNALPPGVMHDAMRQLGDAVRPTTISRGYFLGEREVTWAQLDRFLTDTGRALDPRRRTIAERPVDAAGRLEDRFERLPRGEEFTAADDHPCFAVTWEEAAAYCLWAGLRLPTEAEWEWAARGAEARMRPWGNEQPVSGDCNGMFDDGYPFTAPVGAFPRDRTWCGCLDMAANVAELVADWFAPLTAEPATDPTGPPAGDRRVVRGAPWHHPPGAISLTRRTGRPLRSPGQWNLGFRVAR